MLFVSKSTSCLDCTLFAQPPLLSERLHRVDWGQVDKAAAKHPINKISPGLYQAKSIRYRHKQKPIASTPHIIASHFALAIEGSSNWARRL